MQVAVATDQGLQFVERRVEVFGARERNAFVDVDGARLAGPGIHVPEQAAVDGAQMYPPEEAGDGVADQFGVADGDDARLGERQ
jgi:hypothetical protein